MVAHMSRRTVSSVVVVVLLVLLFTTAAFLPVPYVTMSPGPTLNVLGSTSGKEIVAVAGRKTYRDDGELRLTTVSVTSPENQLSLLQAMAAWFNPTRALYPRDVIYPKDQTPDEAQQEGSVQMVSSQDTAVAVALRELGVRLKVETEVLGVTKGAPADGKLEVRDRILAVNGVPIKDATQVSKEVQKAGVGSDVKLAIRRGDKPMTVTVTTRENPDEPGQAQVGVAVGEGYDFPFDVSVNISEDIGGPSAGLVFSLAVFDRLTPGALTGGQSIAGTGTISQDGSVGPIGGIQQKVIGAEAANAKLFLVPPDNCAAALQAGVDENEIRLVKAPTMHSAVRSLKAFADDPRADLPSCG